MFGGVSGVSERSLGDVLGFLEVLLAFLAGMYGGGLEGM